MRHRNVVLLSALALPSCAFAFATIPAVTWLSAAALSLGAGTSALALMAGAATLGLGAVFYKLFLYPVMWQPTEHGGEQANRRPSVIRPVNRSMPFKAEQFAFPSLHGQSSREPHPFTLPGAGGPEQPVQFLIRAIGDYTERLVTQAKPGIRAAAHKPFGHLRRATRGKREIWIAGGVGISPFIAWLKDDSAIGLAGIILFLFNTPGREFPAVADVRVLAEKRGVELITLSGSDDALKFRHRLAAFVGECGAGNVEVQFCGPTGLLERVRDEMAALGIPEAQLRFELFEFR